MGPTLSVEGSDADVTATDASEDGGGLVEAVLLWLASTKVGGSTLAYPLNLGLPSARVILFNTIWLTDLREGSNLPLAWSSHRRSLIARRWLDLFFRRKASPEKKIHTECLSNRPSCLEPHTLHQTS
jgi:hypothetical protein